MCRKETLNREMNRFASVVLTLVCHQVFGELQFTNMALRKPTWQVTPTVPSLFVSDNAVDGNNDTNLMHSSCMTTIVVHGWIPWLAVDLGTMAHVQWIQLTNTGGLPGLTASNFIVGLTNNYPGSMSPTSYGHAKCGQWPGIALDGGTMTVNCDINSPSARYALVISSDTTITICEFEVYAAGNVNLPWNLKLDKGFYVSWPITPAKKL